MSRVPTPRPFRFGAVNLAADGPEALREKSRSVEDAGFSTFLLADHLSEMLPPLVTLGYLASVTSRIRLGTFVLNNDLRHPVLVARAAAAVDFLSGGRFELGMGAGHMKAEYLQVGIDFAEPSVRTDRLIEAVEIVSSLLEGKTVEFDGVHFRVHGHRVNPEPIQKPRPPILLGGYGRRLLTAAARRVEIIGLAGIRHDREGRVVSAGMTRQAAAERVAWIRQAAPDRFGEIELNALLQVVSPIDPDSDLSRLEAMLGLSADDIRQSPYILLGSTDAMVEQLEERRERLGITYFSVFDRDWPAIRPVLNRLS